MKLNKREKKMLTVLGIIIVLFSYYYFSFRILEINLRSAKENLLELEDQKQILLAKMSTNKRLDEDILNLNEEIIAESAQYYDKIDQEEAMMILVNYAKKASLDLLRFEFIPENADDGFRQKVVASVSFNSNYKAIKIFMKSIEHHSKFIKISNVSFSGNEDGTIKGDLNLEFNKLNQITPFASYKNTEVTLQDNYKASGIDPFLPFDGFIIPNQEQDILIEGEEPQEIDPDYKPKTLLYGFEEGNTFFVGNDDKIFGAVGRSETRKENTYSAYLEFDFVNARRFNEANVVFDAAPVILQKQAETISMWVYAYEPSDHNIGLQILDSAGRDYRLELTKGVEWTQWEEIEANMPIEITYPCIIQRIYVEGVGYEHKLKGRYLFDQLQVTYPIQ
ncbi:hypothetical protein [Fusibacter sp. 3D3]|uniref:hypothetical protein n=1 Tax=Fusibacter sp. 3D3 TaxID=1048380 RepID=UPI0008535742|nr:hypothetical protein [Fusibacter sp. 3D3]GAU79406.1 type IV pilus biogenesis protein PilO [Fusibacter sp. 3D3]